LRVKVHNLHSPSLRWENGWRAKVIDARDHMLYLRQAQRMTKIAVQAATQAISKLSDSEANQSVL